MPPSSSADHRDRNGTFPGPFADTVYHLSFRGSLVNCSLSGQNQIHIPYHRIETDAVQYEIHAGSQFSTEKRDHSGTQPTGRSPHRQMTDLPAQIRPDATGQGIKAFLQERDLIRGRTLLGPEHRCRPARSEKR